jgi:hypothetical protein
MPLPVMSLEEARVKLAALPKEDWINAVKVVERAAERANFAGVEIIKQDLLQDVLNVHCFCRPLNFTRLLLCGDTDFVHDVFGIMRYFDRRTFTLPQEFALNHLWH